MGFIYKITNPSGRIYVGQTKRLKTRVWEYRWRGKKRKSIVHDSVNSYGWAAHKFEIIEECADEILIEREIFWIKELNSYFLDNPKGMNMTRGGEKGSRSWMHDIERRKKQSERFKGSGGTFYGKHHTEENKKYLSELTKKRNKEIRLKVPAWGAEKGRLKIIKPVICYDENGNFFKEFESATFAARELNINRGSISDSLKFSMWIYSKYLFKYKTENYPLRVEVGKIIDRNIKRPIYWLSEDLDVICEFPSGKEASDFFGLPRTTINRAAQYNDLNPIRAGHIFIYKDKYLKEYKISA